jgi:hypothetical protein
MALEKPLIPTFSMTERDRLWSLLRAAMKKANLDALIAPTRPSKLLLRP